MNANTAPAQAPEVPTSLNLRESKRQQARQRHPTGKARQPKAAPGKASAKAEGGKEKEARKAPRRSDSTRLHWKPVVEGGDTKTGPVTAKVDDHSSYEIRQTKDGWAAVVVKNGKDDVLGDGIGRNQAYYALTDFHHWGKRPEPRLPRRLSRATPAKVDAK